MHFQKRIRILLVVVTAAGLVLPNHVAVAETPAGQPARPAAVAAPQPMDLALQADGVLTGRVVDGHGAGLGSARIALHNGHFLVAETTTNAAGDFRFESTRGGVYQLSGGGTSTMCRVWAHQTAPPGAANAILLQGQDVVAGQSSPMKYWLADPLVIGGIVLVVAGVPIILANRNNDSGS